jgi:(p)ppGpp synthase/HD superfamily hydrolase
MREYCGEHNGQDMKEEAARSGLDISMLTAAFGLAAALHDGQVRKGSEAPYLGHLLGVTELVMAFGGTSIEIAAALLHDAVEDTGGRARLVDIERTCGAEVATIVDACSDSFTDTTAGAHKEAWLVRKSRYIDHLASGDVPNGAVLVSACDKLHNLATTRLDFEAVGEPVWERFKTGYPGQLWYYRSVLGLYRSSPDPRVREVAQRLGRELHLLEDALQQAGHNLSDTDDLPFEEEST